MADRNTRWKDENVCAAKSIKTTQRNKLNALLYRDFLVGMASHAPQRLQPPHTHTTERRANRTQSTKQENVGSGGGLNSKNSFKLLVDQAGIGLMRAARTEQNRLLGRMLHGIVVPIALHACRQVPFNSRSVAATTD